MKLATTTLDFCEYTSSQLVAMEFAARAGFRYLDYSFEMDYAKRRGIYSADPREYLESVKSRATELGVKFIQAHSPMGAPIASNNEQFIKDTQACIEACAVLGIPNIVVHSGYERNLTVEETFARNKQFFAPLLETGERLGVNILVENFNKMVLDDVYWIDNAKDLMAFIKYVNHPRLHAVWDTGHGNLQDMPQHEALRVLGSEVYALHVQDNLGDTDSHLAPFFGTLDLDSLMQGLVDIGYTGYFTFESSAMLVPGSKRRRDTQNSRLPRMPLDLRIKAEALLYEIGKAVLTEYGCFEEN